MIEREA